MLQVCGMPTIDGVAELAGQEQGERVLGSKCSLVADSDTEVTRP